MELLAITPGPVVKQFSDIAGCTTYLKGGVRDYTEVVDWANQYINGPWPDDLVPHLEATAEERRDSVKRYIKWRVDESMTSRIKKTLTSQEKS